jgi:Fe-S-cluster containining protein
MKNITEHLFQHADTAVKKAFENGPNNAHCCSKGCFFCCKEPAYCSESEIRYALELLTEEQKKAVVEKTLAWIEKFFGSEFVKQREPDAVEYRRLCLWCPLLAKDGTCSVYDRRPLACRLHYAHGSPEGCKDDDKRSDQKFALFPGLPEKLTMFRLQDMKDGESEDNDHITLMLAKVLIGNGFYSQSRVRFSVSGDSVIVETSR